jgi:hypothetical protein
MVRVGMLKKLSIILAVNAIIVLFFVWTSYSIASNFSNYPNELVMVHWNFFGYFDIYHAGGLVNGTFVATGAHDLFIDFPFWLFFVSTAANLLFIIILLRQKETKQKPT